MATHLSFPVSTSTIQAFPSPLGTTTMLCNLISEANLGTVSQSLSILTSTAPPDANTSSLGLPSKLTCADSPWTPLDPSLQVSAFRARDTTSVFRT
ncbi:hypothetical protein HETIRDRAFT_315969 [Heterobasidion irregulare TC 32-1]|uniref:Uncharacterized protein n=1 Tax=Heterobasidion irregulare (strain TC 32-1) TaxID=747525 RepID=W4K9N8_HETIT|nr:uncharacterized protein HETIRDRAFT_315969 [Heterobasidion irregulare TC 32-1]ETW82464.1 hypothetical protein HETIRDRAFT_315969 [Heterobasidion irregulare TC 32-1]